MSRISGTIYRLPLYRIILISILLVLLWAWLRTKLKNRSIWEQRIWHLLNILLFAISLSAIFYLTLYNRSEGTNDLVPIPFASFQEAKIQPELYRSMLMNVFLFVPLGLFMPNVLPKKWKPIVTIMLTIAFGMCLSTTIEYFQYRYSLGRCEVDDVIMNTLGAAIGTISFVIKVPKCVSDGFRKCDSEKGDQL